MHDYKTRLPGTAKSSEKEEEEVAGHVLDDKCRQMADELLFVAVVAKCDVSGCRSSAACNLFVRVDLKSEASGPEEHMEPQMMQCLADDPFKQSSRAHETSSGPSSLYMPRSASSMSQ